ncbi:MAG: hypothetical protein HYY93_04865 [Planctomycetes bacterium]|nr:hypothetical protein [Planctomycetota bacterium]
MKHFIKKALQEPFSLAGSGEVEPEIELTLRVGGNEFVSRSIARATYVRSEQGKLLSEPDRLFEHDPRSAVGIGFPGRTEGSDITISGKANQDMTAHGWAAGYGFAETFYIVAGVGVCLDNSNPPKVVAVSTKSDFQTYVFHLPGTFLSPNLSPEKAAKQAQKDTEKWDKAKAAAQKRLDDFGQSLMKLTFQGAKGRFTEKFPKEVRAAAKDIISGGLDSFEGAVK